KSFLLATGKTVAVDLALEKRIPVAAGLGGGSSDAAAVLTGLNRIFGRPLSEETLFDLALAIGADVPFLASDSPAVWATGVGECMREATPLSECWIVLVNPGFPVPTKWVYQTFDALASGEGGTESASAPHQQARGAHTLGHGDNFALTTGGNPYILGREKGRTIKTEHPLAGDRVPLRNDLEKVTIGRYHELGAIKAKLLVDGARGSLMSGSGPTVFGIFDEEQQAIKSFAFFVERYGENVFLTKPLQAI
ncbi:MAG: hypothetical protein OEV91_10660, partial [Desulfobulbaceae bacterium]|nr:hypothetical protein [Desulfobulbaceae bacterium]